MLEDIIWLCWKDFLWAYEMEMRVAGTGGKNQLRLRIITVNFWGDWPRVDAAVH